ncbi:Endoribonuclease L-PSP/chorismate mutase-like protein [Polychytrium aggregatum]|uniref:Endoribonuclease L-PSP/chorismate mutase-like protein n=1 Tax=Polychytrium aggregatum TaxID=110093 RepID=UPI0022FDCCE7|nr:Endoribonuclease L-PSP/chorismate mutase-like protein [Polychytrium aggregatum]KAI9206581.1 Endoribonuclease L-PSP/chorismate mutase-like protein [Polychytrium aggregatum]
METNVQRVSSNSKWESIVGYSRAVKKGPFVFVSGTTATDPETGKIAHHGDSYAQTRLIFQNIERGLLALGASLGDVTRTRMYVVDMGRNWDGVAKAHAEFMKSVMPAATAIQVEKLVDPAMLVEIEVDAVVL